jgi:hypothetical protein
MEGGVPRHLSLSERNIMARYLTTNAEVQTIDHGYLFNQWAHPGTRGGRVDNVIHRCWCSTQPTMTVDTPKIHDETLPELLADLNQRGIQLDPKTPYCSVCDGGRQ